MSSVDSERSAQDRQWQIEHSNPTAVVPKPTFVVLIWTFVGISVLALASRVAIRIKTRGRLFFDDYCLFPAVLALATAAAALNQALPAIYIAEAIYFRPDIKLVEADITPLYESVKWSHIHLCTIWTAIFCVKYSFLAFFHGMITNVSLRLSRYFWFVVVYCIIIHAFLVSEPFILCHSFGPDTMKDCFKDSNTLNFALTIAITILDIISDLFIISIPLLVFSMTGLNLAQKVVMGSFLCLSVLMIVMAGIRLAVYHSRGLPDVVWAVFFQYMEGAVAVMMASLTVYRSIFVDARRKRDEKRYKEYQERMRSLFKRSPKVNKSFDDSTTDEGRLPSIPGATMTGMISFIEKPVASEASRTDSSLRGSS